MAYCSKCGTQLSDGAKFCPKCGTPCDDILVDTTNDTEINELLEQEQGETKRRFMKYLPFILGSIVVLGLIGYFNSKDSKGGDNSQSQTVEVDSVATEEAPRVEGDAVFADYYERMIYQGEYVFDAVLTDAALEKKERTFTIKIEGNKVSIPCDGKIMTGCIYNDDLGIDVSYDYGDDMHYISMTLKPNDKEGKEWVGELQPTGLLYNVVLKLKECIKKSEVVKVTEERKTVETEDMEIEEVNLDWLQGHWVYEGQGIKGHVIIQGDRLKVWSNMNPEPIEKSYRINGDEINAGLIDGMDLFFKIDFDNHRIDYGNGNWMRKVD